MSKLDELLAELNEEIINYGAAPVTQREYDLLRSALRDSERYRWLRDIGDSTCRPLIERSRLAFPHVPQHELAPMIDEIIDAVMKEASRG